MTHRRADAAPLAKTSHDGSLPHLFGHTRVAVAGQVHEPLRFGQGKEIDQLGAAWRLAGARKIPASEDGVYRSGFARIGPTGKRDLGALVGNELDGAGSARQKPGLGEQGHRVARLERWCTIPRGRSLARCYARFSLTEQALWMS